MRIAGNRKERDITFHADGALLKEGALFNTEMQKMQSTFRAACFATSPMKMLIVT